MSVNKLLDATSGSSAEFNFKDDGSVIGKFIITGTATAAIKIFEARDERSNNKVLYKASSTNWNGATVALHLKTTHADDAFSVSSQIAFTANATAISEIR